MRNLPWPRGYVHPWVDGWVDGLGGCWHCLGGACVHPGTLRTRLMRLGLGIRMQRGPRLTLPALPTPSSTAKIQVRDGSSVGCWLGQAGLWGRRWDPPASASGEGDGLAAWGSLGRRKVAQRRWQGAREAGRTPQCPLTIAEDTVPVSVGLAPSPPPPTPAPPGRDLWVPAAVRRLGQGRGHGEGRGRLAEELEKAVLTVRLVVLLLEGALVELLEAEGADEVLGVELLGHGGDAAARDGLLAARAQRAPPLVVVRLAVGLPLVLKEAAVDERREALLETEEGGGLFRLGGWGPRQLPGDGQGTVRAATLQTIPPRQAFSTCRVWR